MLDFAIDLARRAGELILEYQRRGFAEADIRTKLNHVDLLTEADLASDRFITEALRAQYRDYGIYSEESAVGALPDDEWLWIVDPVDGTTNFAHGLPLFGVNIGLVHRGEPVLGVTCDPTGRRVYWAERGGGAWVRADGQDRRLRVSATSELRRCLLCTGFPPSRLSTSDNNLAEFGALELQVHGVRRLGSACIDLAWVADGLLDGYWEPRLNPWDWLPGYLLVTEAGGRVTDYENRPWRLTSRSMIASNGVPEVHAALVDAIARVRATLKR